MRRDFSLITRWVWEGSRVLDLGCGDGTLLKTLAARKHCRIQGVEMDAGEHVAAIRKGVPVVQLDIDADLDMFGENTYDVVLLSRTLQAVKYPDKVLTAMLKIAPIAIVSMPNFGYWKNRLRLLSGRAPISKDLPFQWYESPNVHFGSLKDLETLFESLNLEIDRYVPLAPSGQASWWPKIWRNWAAGAALYELHAR
ncbi:MAG: methionine biosynthesis protein MetW [Propionibacteriaceae bacterium]|jgi:methionine biosynthesis protein MetW|nr:methionine biosynthesis protein MetW [Propionibacteriaceae bacterium]